MYGKGNYNVIHDTGMRLVGSETGMGQMPAFVQPPDTSIPGLGSNGEGANRPVQRHRGRARNLPMEYAERYAVAHGANKGLGEEGEMQGAQSPFVKALPFLGLAAAGWFVWNLATG